MVVSPVLLGEKKRKISRTSNKQQNWKIFTNFVVQIALRKIKFIFLVLLIQEGNLDSS